MPLKKSESEPFAVSGLAAAHPELHHYTTFAGLKGIVESNTLWATHFLDLNDSREVFLLEELTFPRKSGHRVMPLLPLPVQG
jgi:hypothetical protein